VIMLFVEIRGRYELNAKCLKRTLEWNQRPEPILFSMAASGAEVTEHGNGPESRLRQTLEVAWRVIAGGRECSKPWRTVTSSRLAPATMSPHNVHDRPRWQFAKRPNTGKVGAVRQAITP
jgi:hypothetical protein